MSQLSDPNRAIQNLEGESLGITIGQYDAVRPAAAMQKVHTLCHAPFAVMDLGPQGQVSTCNHFHRFLGNLHTSSWLDIFRGEDWSRLRQNMLDYKISEMDCRHCARQIRSGHPGNAFAQEHFDSYPTETATPTYPTVIIFRLSNVCNLMCVMCNGTLSHRIRNEREKLPPLPPPPYGEQFFKEMEETLPHVKYIEFYGGEPFLVKEHLRILDIIERTGAKTEIYVNTNGTAITPKVKGYIERLNFIKIAVSVDAIFEPVHARQRVGIKHDVCMENLQWMLDLRKRKKVWVGLNTTETRFNWYHLPVMYRWAAEKEVYIHINTCLHPSDTTLYDLPTEELSYIGDYFARARESLGVLLDKFGNRQSYGHLEAMVRDELTARRDCKKRPNPYPTDREPMYGGLMWVPELKIAPFETAAAARIEVAKVQEFGAWHFAARMARAWLETIAGDGGEWDLLRAELEQLLVRAAPLAEEFERQVAAQQHHRTVQAAAKLEQQGRFAEALEALAAVGDDAEQFHAAEVLRGRCLRRMGRLDEARERLQLASARRPDDAAVAVELAWLCSDTDDIEAGREHARRAQKLAPIGSPRELIGAWAHVLGLLAIRGGDQQEAAAALAAFEQVQPTSPVAVELRQAVEHFDEASARLAIESAWRLERRGQFDAAIATLATIGEGSPLGYEASIPLARALRRSGRTGAARDTLERSLAAHPDRPEALVELAWLCYDTGRLEEGIGHATRAGTLPGQIPAWSHALAALSVAAGRGVEAAAALKRLQAGRKLLLGPVDPPGAETDEQERATIARGWQHEGRGEYAEALRCAAEVAEASPRRLDALVLRSRVQRRQGDLAGALRTMAHSIAVQPVQVEALIELAWLCLDTRQPVAGLAFAACARDLSNLSGDPIGIVGWAHPLGLLASECNELAVLDDILQRLAAVRDKEVQSAAVLDDLVRRLARND